MLLSSHSLFLGFVLYKLMSSVNVNSFASFQIYVTCIYIFSCLISLARTSSTTLSGRNDSGHPHVVFLS